MSAKDAILKKAFEGGGTVDQILGILGSIVKEDESKMFGYGFSSANTLSYRDEYFITVMVAPWIWFFFISSTFFNPAL